MDADGPCFLALGPLAVRRSGRPVELGSPKQRATLGVLMDAVPDPVSIDRLADELWPEDPPRDPLRSIQVYVSSLRNVVGQEAVSLVGRTAYRLAVDPGAIDTVRFGRAAAESRALLQDSRFEEVATVADGALALWRGDAWQDLRRVPALARSATRLDQQRIDLVVDSVAAGLALGRHRDLLPDLEDLVRRHPLREDLLSALMVALYRSGRQAEALSAYAEGRARKVAETGLEPGERLRTLQARVLADDLTLAVEDAELRARRHLPAQVTKLVGRRREVDELVAVLRDPDRRLVTVTGPGGIGKTRVGLQAAHELAASFPGGVWFVGLDDLTDPALVPRAIAAALGVDEVGDDFVSPLCDRLRSRQALLLLDNFEQVGAAAPLLSRLLAAGSGTKILVTSRTRLRLYGEQLWALGPLEPADAGALFVERARGAHRWFDATVTPDIVRVCEALDRIPLAVELVAARSDEVAVADMVTQLESRLDLASSGPRDRSARQRTLRHAIGWSVDLLDAGAAQVFGRLGVFVGGFDEEAAVGVAGATSEVLATLVDNSLLLLEEGRYRLLETIREYAVEISADRQPECREDHARWFRDLAEASVDGMRGESLTAWVTRLDRERGNLRAGLQHFDGQGGSAAEDLLRMTASLGLFWYRTGPGAEDVEWLERSLASAPCADPLLRGRGQHALAICRAEQGRVEQALAHSRESYRLLRETGDETWKARALNSLAGLTRDLGLAEEAVSLMDESIALRRRLDDPKLPVAIALANRAFAALDLGDVATARRCLVECLDLPGSDQVERALTETALAGVAVEEGRLDEAADLLRRALPVLREPGQRYRLVEALDTFAALAVRRGLPQDAAILLAAADQIFAEEGAVQVPADLRLRERRVGRALEALDPAERATAERAGVALGLEGALELVSERLLEPNQRRGTKR